MGGKKNLNFFGFCLVPWFALYFPLFIPALGINFRQIANSFPVPEKISFSTSEFGFKLAGPNGTVSTCESDWKDARKYENQ